jgi:hypothetical protein
MAFLLPIPGQSVSLFLTLSLSLSSLLSPASDYPGKGIDGTFPSTRALVVTPSRNYTAFDLAQLIADEGLTSMGPMYKQIAPFLADGQFGAPGVNTHIVYGYNVDTTCGLLYKNDLASGVVPDAPLNAYYACDKNGDGLYPLVMFFFNFLRTIYL